MKEWILFRVLRTYYVKWGVLTFCKMATWKSVISPKSHHIAPSSNNLFLDFRFSKHTSAICAYLRRVMQATLLTRPKTPQGSV